jgi:hypothetical protein
MKVKNYSSQIATTEERNGKGRYVHSELQG